MTAEEYRRLHQKPATPAKPKPKPAAKSIPDLTHSQVSSLIDKLVLKAPDYVEYREERIECTYQGKHLTITFKIS